MNALTQWVPAILQQPTRSAAKRALPAIESTLRVQCQASSDRARATASPRDDRLSHEEQHPSRAGADMSGAVSTYLIAAWHDVSAETSWMWLPGQSDP
jgi:hypothetical protein